MLPDVTAGVDAKGLGLASAVWAADVVVSGFEVERGGAELLGGCSQRLQPLWLRMWVMLGNG
jgi:hypothetical protein